MMTSKMKQALEKLMKYGYDHNLVVYTHMKTDAELVTYFEEMSQRCINFSWNWYNTSDQHFEDKFKRRTIMRFSLLLGIGAMWLWKYHREEALAKGLYESLSEPRTEFEMDEYICDVTGIGWSKSYEGTQLSVAATHCYDIITTFFDLSDAEQELQAAVTLMHFGMHIEQTRIMRSIVRVPYKGTMQNHFEIWDKLYDKEENNAESFAECLRGCLTTGVRGDAEFVVFDNPESKFAKTTKSYASFTEDSEYGMRALVSNDDNAVIASACAPIFDAGRRQYLILDKVCVWDNGIEATIEAHYPNEDNNRIVFYDTNYLENRDKYYPGAQYVFDIYGIAVDVKMVPEDQHSLTLSGDSAVKFKTNIGEEVEYDENGEVVPISIGLKSLTMLNQIDDDVPELASFRSPIRMFYKHSTLNDTTIYRINIETPFYKPSDDGSKYKLPVFVSSHGNSELIEKLYIDEPIGGVIYLQGRMRDIVELAQKPSNSLHTFDLKNDSGEMALFTHKCDEQQRGELMSDEQKVEFAKSIYHRHFSDILTPCTMQNDANVLYPDFYSTRRRNIWVKCDEGYTAAIDFANTIAAPYMGLYYVDGSIPVIAYVSLYDKCGNRCEWVKGGEYTAKVSYGSMLPNQKMNIVPLNSHDELVNKLYQAYKHLDSMSISKYLHKDLDFRSVNLSDPIITKGEYVARTLDVDKRVKKLDGDHMQPILVCGDNAGSCDIELKYNDGAVDEVRIETECGLIKSIRIESKK